MPVISSWNAQLENVADIPISVFMNIYELYLIIKARRGLLNQPQLSSPLVHHNGEPFL